MSLIITVGVAAVTGVLLLILTQRLRAGRQTDLRPLAGYAALEGQVGRAIETGSQLHITLGQGSLVSVANPTSVAALQVLDHLAEEGCANSTPPLVTVGEGTLLPIAQDSLRYAYEQAGRPTDFRPGLAQFIAPETAPFAYAGGVTNVLHQNRVISNVMVGRFGQELAVMGEAATRQELGQVVGTDDPTALALAIAVTNNVLIGEELFAAGAYLEGQPSQIASLQVQDILRVIIIVVIIGLVVYQLVNGL